MDLNEARKVVWIGSNRRPLGELLDIGYLNRDRLEWAVAHVSDPIVQQAAAVLLTWFSRTSPRTAVRKPVKAAPERPALPGLDVNITLKKAQETIWPFPPYKGELMGPLVATKTLSLKDLGYAIENAYDSKVKAAAIALAAIRLHQIVKEPAPSKGHLHVVSKGRSFSERKQLQLILLEGLVYGIVIGIGFSYFIYAQFIQEHHQPTTTLGEIMSTPAGIAAMIIAICILIGIPLLILLGVEWSANKLDLKVENYRKGQEGENRVVDAMIAALNGEWALFRNVILPGRGGGDLDSVLVGPAGVWVLEVKTLSGEFRNIGDQWECRMGKKWQPIRKNPSQQARKNAARLGGFLEADHIKVWVNSAVVWANPESPLEIKDPPVAVWKLDRLPDELGNILDVRKIPDDDRKKIVEKLTRLIGRQKK